MLIMRDSITASAIPQDTPIVAGYGDGVFVWSSAEWARFINNKVLSIVVNATDSGDILDVENGDATPSQVPGWCDRFNRPGRRCPTVYCNRQAYLAVRSAIGNRRVDFWISTLDGTTDPKDSNGNPIQCVAVQYKGSNLTGANYDESIILDPTWVGENDTMFGIFVKRYAGGQPTGPEVYFFNGDRMFHMPDPGSIAVLGNVTGSTDVGPLEAEVFDLFEVYSPQTNVAAALAVLQSLQSEVATLSTTLSGTSPAVDLSSVNAKLDELGKHLGIGTP